MYNQKICKAILALTLCIFTSACGTIKVEKDAIVMQKGLIDINRVIRSRINDSNGQIHIIFDQKQIPMEIQVLTLKKDVYSIYIELKGTMKEGSITVYLIDNSNKTMVAKRIIGASEANIEINVDMYYMNDYCIRLEFNNAHDGDILLKYNMRRM